MKIHPPFRFSSCILTALGLLLAGMPTIARAQPISKDSLRNSAPIVKIFREVVAGPSQSAVRILSGGKEVALGTVVSEDGYILTKASVLGETIVCKLKNGKEYTAEIVNQNEPYDLALIKIQAKDLVPVQWRKSKEMTPGRWVAAVAPSADPVAIGVIGVATRNFKLGDQPPKATTSNSGYLGVQLDNADDGARIKHVESGGPADKAGLKVDDVVIQAGQRKITGVESFINAVQSKKAGEEIVIKLLRGKETKEIKATLGRLPKGLAGNPQDTFGSELSLRRGGFPSILQHDTVLLPKECGGPLVDLDGKTVGINISRAGRTETYAVPSEAVLIVLDELKAVKIKTEPKKVADLPIRKEERPINDPKDLKDLFRITQKLTDTDGLDKLRKKSFHRVHVVKLQAGVEYTIDLTSNEFDPYLRLEDASGKNLAEDDDSGGDLNARIVYRAPADGEYRVIVTSFEPGDIGEYTLVVRPKK